jgi:hypothetical protein
MRTGGLLDCNSPTVQQSITILLWYIATALSIADEGPSLIPRRQLRTCISHIHLSLEDLSFHIPLPVVKLLLSPNPSNPTLDHPFRSGS